ncbi:hypothetical protein, partial [Glutamicibacter sp.]|uniref:hypothetical protein n=1 Tax=Glutamicibacter sp. TaxID=1931995 RepID=UPI002B49DAE4
ETVFSVPIDLHLSTVTCVKLLIFWGLSPNSVPVFVPALFRRQIKTIHGFGGCFKSVASFPQ